MRKTDLAYAAGIIDGEGSIGIYRQPTYLTWITVRNTNEWICQWLRFAFGGYVYTHTYKPPHLKWKDSWQWRITGSDAADFLRLILPYLRLKKPQAELAIAFQSERPGSGHHLTDDQVAVAEAQRIAMSGMNKRGK